METKPKMPGTSMLIRWLAGASCPFFFFAAIVTAFPHLVGGQNQPSILLAALLLWGGIVFATIAATGKLRE